MNIPLGFSFEFFKRGKNVAAGFIDRASDTRHGAVSGTDNGARNTGGVVWRPVPADDSGDVHDPGGWKILTD